MSSCSGRTLTRARRRARSARLRRRPMRGDRVAKVGQGLAASSDREAESAVAIHPSPPGAPMRPFSAHAKRLLVCRRSALASPRASSAKARRRRDASARSSSAARFAGSTVGGPARLSSNSRHLRRRSGAARARQLRDAVEHRATMAAAHLARPHCGLLGRFAQDRLQPGQRVYCSGIGREGGIGTALNARRKDARRVARPPTRPSSSSLHRDIKPLRVGRSDPLVRLRVRMPESTMRAAGGPRCRERRARATRAGSRGCSRRRRRTAGPRFSGSSGRANSGDHAIARRHWRGSRDRLRVDVDAADSCCAELGRCNRENSRAAAEVENATGRVHFAREPAQARAAWSGGCRSRKRDPGSRRDVDCARRAARASSARSRVARDLIGWNWACVARTQSCVRDRIVCTAAARTARQRRATRGAPASASTANSTVRRAGQPRARGAVCRARRTCRASCGVAAPGSSRSTDVRRPSSSASDAFGVQRAAARSQV